jgi:hypothetical protein
MYTTIEFDGWLSIPIVYLTVFLLFFSVSFTAESGLV